MSKLLIFKPEKISRSAKKTLDIVISRLKKDKIDVTLSSLSEPEFILKRNKVEILIDGRPLSSFDHSYFRLVGRFKHEAFMIANYCKKNKINYIDEYLTYTAEADKLIQMFMLAMNKMPIPDTYYSYVYDRKKIGRAVSLLGLPLVIKVVDMDRGEGVFLCHNQKEIVQTLKAFPAKRIIMQKFIPNQFDYRVVVLEKKSQAIEKKIRQSKDDFRNNAYLGAIEVFFPVKEASKQIIKIAEDAAKIMKFQIAGVDIVTSPEKKHYIFEVNSAPQFTLDEKVSPEIPQFVKFLSQWAKI